MSRWNLCSERRRPGEDPKGSELWLSHRVLLTHTEAPVFCPRNPAANWLRRGRGHREGSSGAALSLVLLSLRSPGLLWNLSSTDELKEELIAEALPVLADRVIIPFSGWCDGNSNLSREPVDPEVFFNATGCLR